MGVTRGPQYPGIEDGLIFCFDPKNRDCWSGGGRTGKAYNLVNIAQTGSISFANAPDEFEGTLTTKGYIQYDGTDDYIDFGTDYNSYLGASDAFSACVWVNVQDRKGSNTVLSNINNNPGGTLWVKGESSGIMRFIQLVNGGAYRFKDTLALTDDTWHFIAATYDGSDTLGGMNIYANGALVSQAGTSTSITSAFPTGTTKIGAARDTVANEFDGAIGPCMIYNRELTASEVLTNYNRLKGRFGL